MYLLSCCCVLNISMCFHPGDGGRLPKSVRRQKLYFYIYCICNSCFFNKEVNPKFMLHRTSHVSHSWLKWTSLREWYRWVVTRALSTISRQEHKTVCRNLLITRQAYPWAEEGHSLHLQHHVKLYYTLCIIGPWGNVRLKLARASRFGFQLPFPPLNTYFTHVKFIACNLENLHSDWVRNCRHINVSTWNASVFVLYLPSNSTQA